MVNGTKHMLECLSQLIFDALMWLSVSDVSVKPWFFLVFFVTLALSGFRTVGGVSYFVSIVACLCVNEQEFCNSLSWRIQKKTPKTEYRCHTWLDLCCQMAVQILILYANYSGEENYSFIHWCEEKWSDTLFFYFLRSNFSRWTT